MGLAQWLRNWIILPYLLGLWLLALGASVLRHSQPAEAQDTPRSEEAQSPAAAMLRLLGCRAS